MTGRPCTTDLAHFGFPSHVAGSRNSTYLRVRMRVLSSSLSEEATRQTIGACSRAWATKDGLGTTGNMGKRRGEKRGGPALAVALRCVALAVGRWWPALSLAVRG